MKDQCKLMILLRLRQLKVYNFETIDLETSILL